MKHNESAKGHITGKITDIKNGMPVFNVAVSVKEQKNRKVITDVAGNYRIDNVNPGEYSLECEHAEYRKNTINDVNVVPGETSVCECQMEQKYKVKLTEPVLLLPLKLEIRKITQKSDSALRVAKFTSMTGGSDYSLRAEPAPTINELEPTEPQYWLRWYPDAIQHITPVGQLSEQEKEDWSVLYQYYQDVSDTPTNGDDSVRDNPLLSFEEFEKLINFDIPELKQEWIKLADKYGVVRARQIAKFHTTDSNWDFDQQFPIYIDLSFQKDLEAGSFSSELRTQLSSQHQVHFSSEVIVTNGDSSNVWKIKDLEEAIELDARLANNNIKITKYSDDGSEAFDLLMNNGMPCPSLPDEIHIYTVKDRKIDGPHITVPVKRDAIRIGLDNLESTKWMDDFDEALINGMGCKVTDKDKVQKIDEADWLIAVGINEGENSRNVFEEMIRRNNAAGEFAILPQDSPTNNSDSQNTDHQSLEDDIEGYLQKTKHRVNIKNVPEDMCSELTNPLLDAHRLQNLFKLNNSTVSEMPGANLMEMSEATAMAILLWKPCIDTLKPRLMADLKITANAWDKIEKFFYEHVRARGNFPIIKVDENPYGILPVMAFLDYCNFDTSSKSTASGTIQKDIYVNFFKSLLLTKSNATPQLDSVAENKYEILEEILQSAPVSNRVTVDLKPLGCALVKEKSSAPATNEKPYPEIGYLADFSNPELEPECFFIDESSPVLKRLLKYLFYLEHGVRFNSPPPMIVGKIIDIQTMQGVANASIQLVTEGGDGLSTVSDHLGEYRISNVSLERYTIQVTAEGFFKALRTNIKVGSCHKTEIDFKLRNKPSHAGGVMDLDRSISAVAFKDPPPDDRTITGVVIKSQGGIALSGVTVHLEGTNEKTLTNHQGVFSFNKLSTDVDNYKVVLGFDKKAPTSYTANVNEGISIIEDNQDDDFNIDRSQCDLQKLAANVLKGVDPEKVEVLLLETLDLLSHRLDAWATGLANQKLQECQANTTQAPPIGAFGWLEKPGQLSLSSFEPEYIQAPSEKQAATAGILRNASIFNGETDNAGAFQINLSSEQVQKGLWYFEGLRQGHLSGELLGFQLERMIYEESNVSGSTVTMRDVYRLRDKYPLELQMAPDENVQMPPEGIENATPLGTVIDGEKFLADKSMDTEDELVFKEIKNRLNQTKDAASDIALCEIINADSNPELRGGWLSFLEGKVLPPREEFVRSRRTGKLLGTKVILPIMAPEDISIYYSSRNPRVLADPILASFCDSLLPNIGVREITVEIGDKTCTAVRSMTILTSELGLDAIDLVIGGENELILKTRAYVLSCWKANDSTDLAVSSPCNILGEFPDFDTTNEFLNEVKVRLLPSQSIQDTLNIQTYLTTAKLIANILHKNETNSSSTTLHPNEIPIINPQQSNDVDIAGTSIHLAERLDRIISHLFDLIINLTDALGVLKKRLLVTTLLQSICGMLQRVSSSSDAAEVDSIIERIRKSLRCIQDTDPELIQLLSDTPILEHLSELSSLEVSSQEMGNHILLLKANILGLEKNYRVLIENSAKSLLTDPKLKLNEISRFGITKALSVFPDHPTYIGVKKIDTTLTAIHSRLIEKLVLLLGMEPELVSYLQFLKTFYQNTSEIIDILIQENPLGMEQKFKQRIPFTTAHFEFLDEVTIEKNNYYDSIKSAVIENIKNLSKDLILDHSGDSLDDLTNLLKQATDKKRMVILTPYLMKATSGHYPNWHTNLETLTPLNDKGRLEDYQKVRPAIANLFSLFNEQQAHKLYQETRGLAVNSESELGGLQSNSGDTDYFYLANNSSIETPYLTFLTIDQWTDGIPSIDESTGVALRYNVPQSEAPNLCIVCVPPNFISKEDNWNADLLACSVYEAIELMKVRMVCTEDNSIEHLLNIANNYGFEENGLPFGYFTESSLDSLFPIAKPKVNVANMSELNIKWQNMSP
jgi:hypothetical protein